MPILKLRKRTGIELSGESKGSFDPNKTCTTCLSSLSIGYSINVTQMQMVKAYSIIANGGKDIDLTIIKSPYVNKTQNQIIDRITAIENAMKEATNIPFNTLKCCRDIMDVTLEAAIHGNPNSISDAGVAGEIASAGAYGSALNVFINLKDIEKITNDNFNTLFNLN